MDDVGDVPLGYTRAVAFSIDLAVHVYIYIELHAYCKYSISIHIRSRDAWIIMDMQYYACIRVCLHVYIHACMLI